MKITASERIKKSWVTRRQNGNDTAWNKMSVPSKESLTNLYVDESKSTHEMGRLLGVSQMQVRRWLIKHGIPRRGYTENKTPIAKGSHLPESQKMAISKASIGKAGTMVGDKHWNWRGGITPINLQVRNSKEYKRWREAVFKRDDFTCQECLVRGGRLEADHIKPFSLYPDLRLDVQNGRTLCQKCHLKIGWQFFKEQNPKKKL